MGGQTSLVSRPSTRATLENSDFPTGCVWRSWNETRDRQAAKTVREREARLQERRDRSNFVAKSYLL